MLEPDSRQKLEVVKMRRFDLNLARSHIGRRVNLHLKDGSVIINVLITEAKRDGRKYGGEIAILSCVTKPKKRKIKIPLKEVEWIKPLNIHLFSLLDNPSISKFPSAITTLTSNQGPNYSSL